MIENNVNTFFIHDSPVKNVEIKQSRIPSNYVKVMIKSMTSSL